MLPRNFVGARSAARWKQDLAAVSGVIVTVVRVEPSFNFGPPLQSLFCAVEPRLQELEQSCRQDSAEERPIRPVHARLVAIPYRHVPYVPGVLTRLSLKGSRRRQLRVTEQTKSMQAGSHVECNLHSYMPLDHPFVIWGTDGYVLAADAAIIRNVYEIRPDELGVLPEANALFVRRDTTSINLPRAPRESRQSVERQLKETWASHPHIIVDGHIKVLRPVSRLRPLPDR